MPTEAEEIWRYSRVGLINFDSFAEVIDCPPAVSVETLATRETEPLLKADHDVFAGLVDAVATSTVIHVGKGERVIAPITVDHDLPESVHGNVAVAHLVIEAGENAEVTVIHRVRSADISGLFVPQVEIVLGSGARVRYVVVQELGPQMVQIGSQITATGRDATLSSMAVSLGGLYARLRFDAAMNDRGGHNELLAVYFAEREQMHDFRTVQHHIAPRTTSELVFKGAVAGNARSVYSGLIKIGVNARGTSANQTNRNLLLSPNASAESVPNLEIENNDVKCSHASAIGPIDDQERYYLESRGVPSGIADRLIVLGFFNELLSRIPDDDLRVRLIASISEAFDRRALS